MKKERRKSIDAEPKNSKTGAAAKKCVQGNGKPSNAKKAKLSKKTPVPLKDKDWSGGSFMMVSIFERMVILFVGERENLFKYWGNATDERTKEALESFRRGAYMANPEMWNGEATESSGLVYMALRRLDMSDERSVATFYHEALHAADMILNSAGVEVGRDGEIRAYLQGHIVAGLLKNIRAGVYATLLPDGTKSSSCSGSDVKAALSEG